MSPRFPSAETQAIAASALSLPYRVEPTGPAGFNSWHAHRVEYLIKFAPDVIHSVHYTRASADAECARLNGTKG